MKQEPKPKRLSPSQLRDREYNKNTTTTATGLPPSKEEFLSSLSGKQLTYDSEYSPSAVDKTVTASRRVDFGEEGFNERLGAGMTPSDNPNDIYYGNQGGLETAAKFVGSVASGAVMKAAQGVAILGSALGEGALGLTNFFTGGLLEKAGYDGEFNLDDATNNPAVKALFDTEDYIKKNLFEVYQPSDWNNKSFLEQVTDGAWWGNEGADGIAFALSNFIPAAILGKAGIGAKMLNGIADMAEANAFTKMMTAGKAGLLRGGKLAEIADRGVQTAFMTSTESLFEAKDTGDNFTQQYLRDYNAKNPNATVQDVKELEQLNPQMAEDLKAKKGDAMKHTFFANMAALSASNWIQAGMLNKMMGKASKSVLGAEIQAIDNITDPLVRIQRKGLDKFFNNTRVGYTANAIGQNMVTEGLYEENIQHAIQNVSEHLALNGKIDTMKYIEEVGRETITNLGDKEAWKSIGAGMIIGGLFGGVTASGIPGVSKGAYGEKEEAIKNGITKLNELSNNVRSVGQIYQKDTEGNFVYDVNGNPKIDNQKLQNFVGNLVQAKNTQEIHDYYKSKGENELADIVKNEHIANYVKGFMESGLEEELHTQIKNLSKMSEEDSINMGFDPIELNERGDKVTIQQRQQALEETVNNYVKEYKNIARAVPSNERARQGEALSWYARYKHLQGLEERLNQRRNTIAVSADVNNSALTAINVLADKHAALLAELPNQEKFSLPKRTEATKRQLVLIEKEIEQLKLGNLVELEEAGVVVSPGVERLLANETPEYKELTNINKTLVQVTNSIGDAQDNYNNLIDPKGGKAFYQGMARKVSEIIDADENSIGDYEEGDYVEVISGTTGVSKSGFVSRNEQGRLSLFNVPLTQEVLDKNKVLKYTEEQRQTLKDRVVEEFRKGQIASEIESNLKLIEILKGSIKNGQEHILKQLIEKEDIVLNYENGTVRVTEKQFAKQLGQIEKTIADYELFIQHLEEDLQVEQNFLTSLRYLYDTEETTEDIQKLIETTEAELVETETQIAAIAPLVDRLKKLYFSMLNAWKSLFPTKEYKSLEDRALEIEDAIERGVDPATFEEKAIGIANKLSDYTDYKQDLQLTGAEMRALVRDLDELNSLREALYGKLEEYQNKLKSYELEANKLNYTKVLRPETGQKEGKDNPPVVSKDRKTDPFFDRKRSISATLFGTAGLHATSEGLTEKKDQLRWFKFTEEYNPEDKNRRLRTVTIKDEVYGVGAPQDIFKDDAKEYQHDNHVKVLVVNNENEPVYKDGELIFTSLTEYKETVAEYGKTKGKLSEDGANALNEQYKSFLDKAKVEPQTVDIISRSNGIAIKGKTLISIKKAFGTEEVDLRAIREKTTVINKQEYPLEKGLVYAVKNGRPVGLIVRTLSQGERDAAVNLLKEYAKVRGSKEAGVTPQSILKQLTSTFFLGQRVGNEELSIFFIKGEDKLAFGDNIISHEDLIGGKFDMQLDQFLSQLNHHIDYSLLNNKKEYRDINGTKWNNYNEYLVQEREDAPLMSDLRPISDNISEPQFVGTYLEFSDGKAKVKAKVTTTTKGKKKNFAEGLSFDSISSINAMQDREPSTKEPKTDLDKANEALESGDLGNVKSFESMFRETEPEDEPKLNKKEQVELPGGVKVDLDEIASFKNTAASIWDELGETAAEITSRVQEENNDKVGSDSLFNLEFNVGRINPADYTPIDFEKEKQWFRENISSRLPFEKVANLIDNGNFGKFTSKGEVLISDVATAGTGYHEAFHVVTNLFLTVKEQNDLHNEWLNKNKDRIASLRQQELYQGKSDTFIAEEELAEEFREYMLTDQSEYKTWFDSIIDFIKGLLDLSSSQKAELFSKISKGVYKDSNRILRPTATFYSRIKQLGATANKELMDGMTVTLFANLAKTGFDIQDIRKFNSGELGPDNIKLFANIYNNTYDLVIADIMKYAPATVNRNMTKADFVKLLATPQMRKAIIASHAEFLYQYNIQFSFEEETDLQNLPEDEKSRDTLGIVDSIEFSTKNSMPSAVKIAIASLPQIQVINGKKSLKRSGLGLLMPTDYRRNVAVLHNTLANVSSFEEMLTGLQNLVPKIPEISELIKKLNHADSTTAEGMYLQSQFRQQFDKNRYTFYIQLFDGNNSYIMDANSSKMVDLIKSNWQGALRRNTPSTKVVDGILYLNEEYFKENYNTLGDNIEGKVLSFYKDLGITFSSTSKVNIDVLADTMQVLMGEIKEGEVQADVFNQDGIKGYMNRVVEQEVATSLDYSDNQHINPEGKTVYNISLNDYLSITSNLLNQGKADHLVWNEATGKGNPLVRNSQWLKRFAKGNKIKTIILEGARVEEVGETGKSTAKLTTAEAAVMQFGNIMKGNFPFLRAGDKSLEKGFTFNTGTPKDVEEIRIQEANEIFRGYLADELLSAYMLNVEEIGADISVYNKLGKKLRLFEGVLNKEDQKLADTLMTAKQTTRKATIKAIDKFIERDSVKKAIDTYLDSKVTDNIKILKDNKIVKEQDGVFINLGLPIEIVEQYTKEETLTKGQLQNLMGQFTYHALIANVEQTKLFTGDVAFFKDFFKRTSGLVGTGKTAWVGTYVDKLLNRLFPRPDKKSDSKLRTFIYNDVAAASDIFNDYVKAFVENGYTEAEAKEILGKYLDNNEADGQGYVTLPEYREFNIRMGDWSNDREEVYQKAMNNQKLDKGDMQMLTPEKPQMFAPQEYNELYVPTFYKFSVIPLIPSVIKGRTLEKLNQHMLDNGVGMSVFESGNKVGSKNVRPFYNTNGEFNTDNTISHVVDYSYMKKQLDINPKAKDEVIFGTQFRKLILTGLMNKVLTIKGKVRLGTDVIKEYNGLIDRQINIETTKLIERLGITKTGSKFTITKPEVLRDILIQASKDRSAPDNQIESLFSIFAKDGVKPAELSVNRNKIEQILMSLVNSSLISQKVRGGMLVQAASTGFETKPRRQSDIAKEKWASNLETLNFYKPTDGSTLAMEVYLPYKFKELFTKDDIGALDERLREMIAFRIPTQGVNSIEAIRVKGFLPREAGDIVIVPTEGVTKSGWDFDVDKLNIFMPNYTFNKFTRKPEYIEYEEGTENVEAIQNRLIELSRQIVLAKENFVPLTTPNTTKDLLKLEKEIASLNPELGRNENDRSKFMDWGYNLAIRSTYLLGKTGVGQAALQNVNHVMTQIAKVKMKTGDVFLQHHGETIEVENGTEHWVDLGQEKDVQNNRTTIQEVVSQTLNGFVDIANDPFLKTLNVTPETTNTYFFLTRIGVPIRDVVLFLNQPIIRDFIAEQETNQAMFLDEEETMKAPEVIEAVLSKWQGGQDVDIANNLEGYKKALSANNLASYIKDGGKDKAIQRQILEDYVDYRVEGQKLVSLINAVTFDTTSSASIEGARTKVENFFDLNNSNNFKGLNSLIKDTFLGSFAKATEASIGMYEDLFITEKNKGIRNELNRIKADLKPVFNLDLEKNMNLVKNEMISYLLQNSKVHGNKLGNYIDAMFINKSSNIARTIAILRTDPELKDNYLIRELTPILSYTKRKEVLNSDDVNNLKMFTKRLVTEEQNLITDAWRELFEFQTNTESKNKSEIIQNLASDLMIMAMLQSGINNSPLSFSQFIPNEYYYNLSSKLIDNVIDDNINLEEFREKFYQNNYKSADIVPRVKNSKKYGTGIKHQSERPYVKTWNKAKKNWKLFKNTYEKDGKNNIFEEVNKLGDGFNFKEYANPISVLADNNISAIRKTEAKDKKSTSKSVVYKSVLIQQVRDSDLNDRTQQEYIKRINDAKSSEEVADIVEELCK